VDLAGPERGWNKLAVFAEELYDLKGQVLCLDLDLIITGSLDDFFDYPGDVLIIKDWIKKDGTGNSSVYRFRVGAHAEVLSEFERSFDQVKKTHRNEQEYMSAAMNAKGALGYWPDHWCRSFKRHCIQPFAMFLARETVQPADMRVLVFHGKPDPDDAIAGNSGKWYRRFKPAAWVAEHWH
jgi:alpha-N-acetylglucosamine transferase